MLMLAVSIGATGAALAQTESEIRREIGRYRELLSESRALHNRAAEGAALNNLGHAYRSLSEYRTAIDFYEQALVVWHELPSQVSEAVTLNNLGTAYFGLSEYSKAKGLHEQALAIARSMGDRAIEGKALYGIGVSLAFSSRSMEAAGVLRQALAIHKDRGDRAGEAATLNALALASQSHSKYAAAIDFYTQALTLSEEIGAPEIQRISLHGLGGVYRVLGDIKGAIAYYERSLSTPGDDRAARGSTLNSLGLAYAALGEHEKAIRLYQQALSIRRAIDDRAGQGATLHNLARASNAIGRYDEAIRLYERALVLEHAVGDRAGEARTLSALGVVQINLKRYAKATDLLQQALPIRREVEDGLGEATTLGQLMRSLALQKKPGPAIFFGKQAINKYQEIRRGLNALDQGTRESYVEAHTDAYRFLADLLLEQHRIAEAQQVLHLLKKEEFIEFVRSAPNGSQSDDADLTPPETESDLAYRQIANRLTALGRERGQLITLSARTREQQDRLESLNGDLAIAGQEFRRFLNSLQASHAISREKLDQIKDGQALMGTLRELGPGVVAVYTLVTEDRLRLILFTADVRKAVEVRVTRKDLEAKVVAFRTSINRREANHQLLAQELYRLIVGPIKNDLTGAKAEILLWSLDGALRYLPVAALHDGQHYLMESYQNVVFTPASYLNLKDRPQASWRVLGFGNSSSLPEVRNELEAIIRDEQKGTHGVLPGQIALDRDFSEKAFSTVSDQGYPVVHIATHFTFNPGDASIRRRDRRARRSRTAAGGKGGDCHPLGGRGTQHPSLHGSILSIACFRTVDKGCGFARGAADALPRRALSPSVLLGSLYPYRELALNPRIRTAARWRGRS